MEITFQQLTNKILEGYMVSPKDIPVILSASLKEIFDASERITRHFSANKFDMCSIINAKSGRCPEDCKWCAQSLHYKTSIDTYPLVDASICYDQAYYNQKNGVNRFSLVTSGRKPNKKELDKICLIYKELKNNCSIKLCASLGLLNTNEMLLLKEAGVTRYHCNLETAPTYFNSLCTTHSQESKIKTLRAAISVGMDVCSGGIIGMGETLEQRIELAFVLRELNVKSIPINILAPIKGTPLASIEKLSDDDILLTIAIFRFINPDAYLRFSGGRAQINKDTQRKALRIGINAAIVGDLLTTIGSKIQEDKELFYEEGYEFK